VQEACLAGLFGIGEQMGMAGQIIHRLQVGVLLLHVTGHVPALHGATGERVAQDGDLLVGHGLLDAGRASNPLFGNDLDVVLDEGRLQAGHRAGHHLGAAAQALAQQVGGGDVRHREVHVGDVVGQHPVDLFRHAVERAQAGLDVDEHALQLLGSDGGGQRGVDIPHYQYALGGVLLQLRFHGHHDARRDLGLAAAGARPGAAGGRALRVPHEAAP